MSARGRVYFIAGAVSLATVVPSLAHAQVGGCNVPVPANVIWQEGESETSRASVKTVRNADMCPWQSRVEAWQGAPLPCGDVMTAQDAEVAAVAWTCWGEYGGRSQSRGKHWLIKWGFDWTFLGETAAEVTLQRPSGGDCDRPAGVSPDAPNDCEHEHTGDTSEVDRVTNYRCDYDCSGGDGCYEYVCGITTYYYEERCTEDNYLMSEWSEDGSEDCDGGTPCEEGSCCQGYSSVRRRVKTKQPSALFSRS